MNIFNNQSFSGKFYKEPISIKDLICSIIKIGRYLIQNKTNAAFKWSFFNKINALPA
jgi:hypothetical protein